MLVQLGLLIMAEEIPPTLYNVFICQKGYLWWFNQCEGVHGSNPPPEHKLAK